MASLITYIICNHIYVKLAITKGYKYIYYKLYLYSPYLSFTFHQFSFGILEPSGFALTFPILEKSFT